MPWPCSPTAGSWWRARGIASTPRASSSLATGRTAASIPASVKAASCERRSRRCMRHGRSTCRSRPTARSCPPGSYRRAATSRTARTSPLTRHLPDGHLDPSFSRDGRATVDFGYGPDIAYAVAHQSGGRILVAGQGTRNRYRTEHDFAFARFRRDGRLDRSFSGNGKRTVELRQAAIRRRLRSRRERVARSPLREARPGATWAPRRLP